VDRYISLVLLYSFNRQKNISSVQNMAVLIPVRSPLPEKTTGLCKETSGLLNKSNDLWFGHE
jgi:hypothetical protein